MIVKNAFWILLMCIATLGFSQQKQNSHARWHLTITDSATGKGIGKVTISINNRNYYSTDIDGAIDIDKALIDQNDSIIISCIGYKSITVKPIQQDNYPDTVQLSASVTLLKEIGISSGETKGVVLGIIKKTYNTHRVPNPNQEYAQYIPNDKKIKGTIITIEYVLNDDLHGIEKPFKVGMYTKRKNSPFPDKELIEDSLIVYNLEKKKNFVVDVSKYNIAFPEDGVIVSFGTLSPSYYGTEKIWYDRKPQGSRWILKMPGLDMDLAKKGYYTIDPEKLDRTGPYGMVAATLNSKITEDYVQFQSYIFTEGNNFAIHITVQ